MEPALAILAGGMTAVAVWLMLTGELVRFLLGLTLISNAVNLAIFTAGRLDWAEPPLIAAGALVPPAGAANALPQALVLTAIVIGFGLFAFVLALTLRAHALFGTIETAALPDAGDDAPETPARGARAP